MNHGSFQDEIDRSHARLRQTDNLNHDAINQPDWYLHYRELRDSVKADLQRVELNLWSMRMKAYASMSSKGRVTEKDIDAACHGSPEYVDAMQAKASCRERLDRLESIVAAFEHRRDAITARGQWFASP